MRHGSRPPAHLNQNSSISKNLFLYIGFLFRKNVPVLRKKKKSCVNSHSTCTYFFHLNQFLLLSGSTSILLPNSLCSISMVSGGRGQRQAHIIFIVPGTHLCPYHQLNTKIWSSENSREISKVEKKP